MLKPSFGWHGEQIEQGVDSNEASHEQSGASHGEGGGGGGLSRVVGGMDLSVKFARQEDLQRVVHAARGVGWSPDYDVEHRDWESAGITSCSHTEVAKPVQSVYFE